MELWQGTRIVHETVSEQKLVALETRQPHAMVIAHPERTVLPLPGMEAACACNECPRLRLDTLDKIRDARRDLQTASRCTRTRAPQRSRRSSA